MNTIELYKLLPRKNCGECPQKLCMPFAFDVTKGKTDISQCPLLSEQQIQGIRDSLVISDWREDLIAKLRDDIKKINYSKIAKDIGGELNGDAMILKYLGEEFFISSDGEITTQDKATPRAKILLLNYIKTGGKGDLSGRWVSFSELKNGMLKYATFKGECEDALNVLFSSSMDKAASVLTRLGAIEQDGFHARCAWRIYLLPKIPVLILYWKDEEDFPSQTKILFDSVSDRFLDVESLVFLVEGLIENIEYGINDLK